MEPESEFRRKCRSITFQGCLDHLTSCVENRYRVTRIGSEPKDATDFLEALDDLRERITKAGFHPVEEPTNISMRKSRIKRAEIALSSTFSSFESYRSERATRGLFRSLSDSRNYHEKMRTNFEEGRANLLSEIARWTKEIGEITIENAKIPERKRRALLVQCDELRIRGEAWKNEGKTCQVPWVILPRSSFRSTLLAEREPGSSVDRHHEERLDRILDLNPSRIFKGVHEFSGYFAFTFESSEWVVFESDRFGNALYVVRGNWVAMSRMTKRKLLLVSSGNVRRIVHKGDWFGQLRIVMGFL